MGSVLQTFGGPDCQETAEICPAHEQVSQLTQCQVLVLVQFLLKCTKPTCLSRQNLSTSGTNFVSFFRSSTESIRFNNPFLAPYTSVGDHRFQASLKGTAYKVGCTTYGNLCICEGTPIWDCCRSANTGKSYLIWTDCTIVG